MKNKTIAIITFIIILFDFLLTLIIVGYQSNLLAIAAIIFAITKMNSKQDITKYLSYFIIIISVILIGYNTTQKKYYVTKVGNKNIKIEYFKNYYSSTKNIILTENDKYKWTGTMYSLSKVKNIIDDDFLENPKAELIYTKYYTNPYCNNFKVYTYPQLNNSILPNYQGYYDKFKGIVSSRCPELQWGVTGE